MRPACLSFVLRTSQAPLLLLLLLLMMMMMMLLHIKTYNTHHTGTHKRVTLPAWIFLDFRSFTRSYSEAPQRRPANAFTLFTPTPSVPLPKSDAWWPRAIDLKKRKKDEREDGERRGKDGGGGTNEWHVSVSFAIEC